MNQRKIFQNICEIYATSTFDIHLYTKIENLNKKKDSAYIAKKYLLQFLLDSKDKTQVFNNYNDLWFVKDKVENIELIKKYIKLMIDYINNNNNNSNILNIINNFLETSISKKIIYTYLIIDKCGLPNTLILSFLGYILGDTKKFIKLNYIECILSLLAYAEINIQNINSEMPIYEMNEKVLEIINLIIFLRLKNIRENKDMNEEIEEDLKEKKTYEKIYQQKEELENFSYLYNALLDKTIFNRINIYYFYKRMIDTQEFDEIFLYDNEGNETNENTILKTKINYLKNDIKKELFNASEKRLLPIKNDILDNTINCEQIKTEKESIKYNINKIQNKKDSLIDIKQTNIKEISAKFKNNPIIEENSKYKNTIVNQNINNESKILEDEKKDILDKEFREEIKDTKMKTLDDIYFIKETNSIYNNVNILEKSQIKEENNKKIIKEKEDECEQIKQNQKMNIEAISNLMKINFINENKSSKITQKEQIDSQIGSDPNESTLFNSNNNNKINFNKLYKINNYIKYPDIKNLENLKIINEETKDIKDFIFNLFKLNDLLSSLREKIIEIKNSLNDHILIIQHYKDLLNYENNIKYMKIKNERLEIIIEFLQNPNLILIKKKILEVFLFELYRKKKEYFQIPINYNPKKSNLEELKKLIISKLNKNYNNKKAKNDINKINELISNIHEEDEHKIKGISQNLLKERKKEIILDDYNILKNFLEFYKQKLNPIVHINEGNGKYFFIPELLKNNVEEAKYFSKIKIVSNAKRGKEKKEKNIYDFKEKKKLNQDIYIKDKVITIDSAFDIIFSKYSELNFLENNLIKYLDSKKNKFKDEISYIYNLHNNLFSLNFSKTKINYGKDLEKIKIISDIFSAEVLTPINNYFISLLDNKQVKNEDFNIILKIKNFLQEYIDNCHYSFEDCQEIYKKYGYITSIYLKIKLFILDNLEKMFENNKKIFYETLSKKGKAYLLNLKRIKKNLENYKLMIKKQKYREDVYNFYEEWIQKIKIQYGENNYKAYKSKFEIENIKNFLKDLTSDINLEMNYTYDENFCLWAIKNGYDEYFFNNS